jgi:hypothetical protein
VPQGPVYSATITSVPEQHPASAADCLKQPGGQEP